MDVNKIIQHWLASAENDLSAFRHLYEAKDYSQCLFWGHLVLEKTLKALVVRATGRQSPYTHDLALLASKTGLELSQQQRDHLNEINTFNQFGRYDDEILTFVKKCTPQYTETYFLVIQQLYVWLKDHFQKRK